MRDLFAALDTLGFVLVPGAIDDAAAQALESLLGEALACPTLRASRDAADRIVGSRHLQDDAPALCNAALALVRPLAERVMGQDAGLVRALFFDKPVGGSWALPWHRDRVIAVRDTQGTSRPGGVPLQDAGDDVLRTMLAVRIHLDDADEDNGALRVKPGSHLRSGDVPEVEGQVVPARRGDVLLLRPLLLHASGRVRSARPRRVIHLELAPRPLPAGLSWHAFWPLDTVATHPDHAQIGASPRVFWSL